MVKISTYNFETFKYSFLICRCKQKNSYPGYYLGNTLDFEVYFLNPFQITVQMFEGRRTLNWKYYQAVIMIEYYQDDLPSPFEILTILPWTICGIRKLLKKICSCNCNIFGKDAERGNSRIVQR